MIKMSDLADRKNQDKEAEKERIQDLQPGQRNTYTPEKRPAKNIDYNALDYEDHSDNDQPKKKVASLVQYSSNNEQQPPSAEKSKENQEQEEADKVLIERSQFLAEALGVQVKTGQDHQDKPEPKNAMSAVQKVKPVVLHAKVEGPKDFQRDRRRRSPETAQQEERAGRNKFETEKPANLNAGRNFRTNGLLNSHFFITYVEDLCFFMKVHSVSPRNLIWFELNRLRLESIP